MCFTHSGGQAPSAALRLLGRLLWHCASHTLEAELHLQRLASRLLSRQPWRLSWRSRYFANSGGRASSTDFATAIIWAVLVMPLALHQEDPASLEDTANTDSVEALFFAIPGGRASPKTKRLGDRRRCCRGAVLLASPGGRASRLLHRKL